MILTNMGKDCNLSFGKLCNVNQKRFAVYQYSQQSSMQENEDFPSHLLGTVCFWKQNMECTRVHNLETSHLTPIYCTDMVILPNVNHIAVCTSESDIRFFELSGNGSLVCVGNPMLTNNKVKQGFFFPFGRRVKQKIHSLP